MKITNRNVIISDVPILGRIHLHIGEDEAVNVIIKDDPTTYTVTDLQQIQEATTLALAEAEKMGAVPAGPREGQSVVIVDESGDNWWLLSNGRYVCEFKPPEKEMRAAYVARGLGTSREKIEEQYGIRDEW